MLLPITNPMANPPSVSSTVVKSSRINFKYGGTIAGQSIVEVHRTIQQSQESQGTEAASWGGEWTLYQPNRGGSRITRTSICR